MVENRSTVPSPDTMKAPQPRDFGLYRNGRPLLVGVLARYEVSHVAVASPVRFGIWNVAGDQVVGAAGDGIRFSRQGVVWWC